MKRLTIMFLQELYAFVPQQQQALAQMIREELMADIAEIASGADSRFCSPTAQTLQSDAIALRARLETSPGQQEIFSLWERTAALCEKARTMREQTRRQLSGVACPDPDSLHLCTIQEEPVLRKMLNDYLHLELYRLLVLGGTEVFRQIPPLSDFPDQPAVRLRYEQEYLRPAAQRVEHTQPFGLWAVCFQSARRLGATATLPAYILCAPDEKAGNLLPGEHQILVRRSEILFQGLGLLTNLTPDTIERAQHEPVRNRVLMRDLWGCQAEDPIGDFAAHCGEELYAVDAGSLFAAAALAQGGRQISRRRETQQCLYCGAPAVPHQVLCANCLRRIELR